MPTSDGDGIVRTAGLGDPAGDTAEAAHAHLRQRVAALESELAERGADLDRVREQRDSARAERAAAREELAEARAELAERKRELEAMSDWAEFLAADLERQRERVRALEAQVASLESRGALDWLRGLF